MKLLVAPLLLTLIPLALPSTSLAPTQDAWSRAPAAEEVTANVPEVFFFTPEHARAVELYTVAEQLYGRRIFIPDESGRREVRNMMMIDNDRILVFDFPARAKETLALLEKLDATSPTNVDTEPPAPTMVTVDYHPRALPLGDLTKALTPYFQALPNGQGNISTMNMSDLLILRGSEEETAEMIDLLHRIDVPAPQIELTCYILETEASTAESTAELPDGLAENLTALLPFYHFRVATLGVLRLSARSGSLARLDMPVSGGVDGNYSLELTVSAFDDSSKTLSMSRAEAGFAGTAASIKAGYHPLFRTDAALTGGEYAVLGAAGSSPTFVVLHFRRIGE
jgi:hypothetical protein